MDQSNIPSGGIQADSHQPAKPELTQNPDSGSAESKANEIPAAGGVASSDATGGTTATTTVAGGGNGVAPGSPKVQFGIGTKERDGSVKGVRRVKKSFKDIKLKDVVKMEQGDGGGGGGGGGGGDPGNVKSILKATRSEPIMSTSGGQAHSFDNKAFEGDNPARGPSIQVAATSKSGGFPFLRKTDADGRKSSAGLADVVDLLIQRSSIDLGGRDMHPFGRDCSIEGMMQASTPKSHSKNSAFGKLVIWMTLLSFLLGAACGIIFLSETYNATLRENEETRQSLLLAALNATTT